MLNITDNKIHKNHDVSSFKSIKNRAHTHRRKIRIVFSTIFIISLLFIMLPWRQNIRAKGYITTRTPMGRPQSIPSAIDGRIEKWFVKEGDLVHRGDTIAFLSEVKNEYLDSNLVQRTEEQFEAKNQSVENYEEKVKAIDEQIEALEWARRLKTQQANNKINQLRFKVQNDSLELIAINNTVTIAKKQLDRTQKLYEQGIKSLQDLEMKKIKFQDSKAKKLVQQNKFETQKNELLIGLTELESIRNDYDGKIAKSKSDKFSAEVNRLKSVGDAAKLNNQLENYNRRKQFHYVTAPQKGYITKMVKEGIGEIVKEGKEMITIAPSEYELAVEAYIKPLDLPIVHIGTKSRIQFDGWPAVAFGGWPNTSFGTFKGEVVAIDKYISKNGKYRILITATEENHWPELLNIGAGAKSFLLLKRVPIWYELWRQLNGFPADFYEKEEMLEDLKKKAPIKSVK